jgi:hypothetical protein
MLWFGPPPLLATSTDGGDIKDLRLPLASMNIGRDFKNIKTAAAKTAAKIANFFGSFILSMR